MNEIVPIQERLAIHAHVGAGLSEHVKLEHARVRIEHKRPQDYKKLDTFMEDLMASDPILKARVLARGVRVEKDGLWVPDPKSYIHVDDPEEVLNVITSAGRDQLHLQGYGTTGLASNGFNYIGLSNSANVPASTDTFLIGSTGSTTEITTNGLDRVQGAYSHTAGTNTTTVSNTFTATGTQSCQCAALFNGSSVGSPGSTMNHEIAFTQRSLILNDTLAVTYTITLG
jgi:hypothetical protein